MSEITSAFIMPDRIIRLMEKLPETTLKRLSFSDLNAIDKAMRALEPSDTVRVDRGKLEEFHNRLENASSEFNYLGVCADLQGFIESLLTSTANEIEGGENGQK